MQLIPLSQITRNPDQPRETFPQEHIERLAASIKKRGLMQAIIVRKINPNRYMIVAGECRFRAHQLLGLEVVKAEIAEIDAEEMQLQAIVENLQRQDMNPIEEANAFRTLIDRGYDAQRIVDELGLKSTALVTQRLALLNLSPEIQALVASGQLATIMAWGVAQLPSRLQIGMVKAISAGKFRTSEQVKAACFALRDADQQMDAFGELPRASASDIATVSRLENKIAAVVDMTRSGFKDGECVAAQRVSPDRLIVMADKLVLVRKHVLQMEHDLRRVATQTEIMRSIERTNDEGPEHPPALRLADRDRTQARRKQNVDHKLSRPASDPRRAEAAR